MIKTAGEVIIASDILEGTYYNAMVELFPQAHPNTVTLVARSGKKMQVSKRVYEKHWTAKERKLFKLHECCKGMFQHILDEDSRDGCTH